MKCLFSVKLNSVLQQITFNCFWWSLLVEQMINDTGKSIKHTYFVQKALVVITASRHFQSSHQHKLQDSQGTTSLLAAADELFKRCFQHDDAPTNMNTFTALMSTSLKKVREWKNWEKSSWAAAQSILLTFNEGNWRVHSVQLNTVWVIYGSLLSAFLFTEPNAKDSENWAERQIVEKWTDL